MGLRKNAFKQLILGALTLALLSTSAFASTTFAGFIQQNSNKDFSFKHTAASTTFSATSAVNFFYLIPMAPALTGLQDATLTLTSTTNSIATMDAQGKLIQPIDSGKLSIKRKTAIGGLDNLLTVDFKNADIIGDPGAHGVNFGGATPPQPLGDVVFTSDFLNFTNTDERSFALSFTSVTPALLQNPSKFLRNFTATGSGVFSTGSTEAPEPASMALTGAGGLAFALFSLRKRK